jgi:hypothetical protein
MVRPRSSSQSPVVYKASKFLEILRGSRRPISLPFMPVDVRKEVRTRRLAERGAEDGAKNLPMPASGDLRLAEQEIVTDISAERERCARDLASHLRAYRNGLSGLQTGMDVAGLRQEADEAIRRVHEIRSRWSGDVAELRRSAASLEAELSDFKSRNRLTREPRLPKNRFLSFSLLLVVLVTETGFNALFFAGGSDLGLMGGAGTAFVLSVVNITMGTLAGLALRFMNSRRWFLAVMGFIGFLCAGSAIVTVNAVITHYRELYQSTGDATSVVDAWSQLRAAPFDVRSLWSWFLFALGLGISGTAIWKGYAFDDPYPGYGPAARRRNDAVEAYNGEHQALVDEAADIAGDYSDKAKRAIENLRSASSTRQQIQNARARMLASYVAHENDLAQAAQQLRTTYREANLASRTLPSPAHFGERFAFAKSTLDRPEFKILLSDQGLEHDAETLINELDSLRRRVLDEHAIVLALAPGEI